MKEVSGYRSFLLVNPNWLEIDLLPSFIKNLKENVELANKNSYLSLIVYQKCGVDVIDYEVEKAVLTLGISITLIPFEPNKTFEPRRLIKEIKTIEPDLIVLFTLSREEKDFSVYELEIIKELKEYYTTVIFAPRQERKKGEVCHFISAQSVETEKNSMTDLEEVKDKDQNP